MRGISAPIGVSKITDSIEEILGDPVKEFCSRCLKTCCNLCAKYEGHFMFEGKMFKQYEIVPPEAQAQLDWLKKSFGWSNDKGFLGENGCLLPREFRSITCQRSNCDIVQKALSPSQVEFLREHVLQLKRLRELARFIT